ncbi:tautomerase family protein [Streptomyces microflavus]|uniref:Tautomerase family protein n=1 Tax=Streptomyces microflavus TaxID=1919 RepID=A0A7H8MM74_STRMI|nr:tautomerase family protein [Streptomyces microflavus]QKW43233.1 tautomerase family protein [Streptomyces microflavus]
MPHVHIQHFTRTFTEAEKADLVEALTEAVTRVFGTGPDAVSIAVEPVDPSEWTEEVYRPQIEARPHLLWKRPGYTPSTTTEGDR